MKNFWRKLLNIITFGLLDLRLAKTEDVKAKLESIKNFVEYHDLDKDGYITANELWKMLKDLFKDKKDLTETPIKEI